MEDISTMIAVVLEQVRLDLIREARSPGPTHVIVVIEMDQLSNEKVGIRHYLSQREYVVARTETPSP
jgi:hypothetical protein